MGMGAYERAGRVRMGGFTLVELMIVLAILGVLSSLAVPTVALYIRRTKTGEARLHIAKLFDASASFFASDRVDRGDVGGIGQGGTLAQGAHRCPFPLGSPAGGQAGLTPTIPCADGPSGRCVPSTSPAGPGYYDFAEWTENQVWFQLDFQQEQAHHYRYNYASQNSNVGYGSCQFTAQAFGDLDGDGLHSTFERPGAADQNGVNAAWGLHIRRVVE